MRFLVAITILTLVGLLTAGERSAASPPAQPLALVVTPELVGEPFNGGVDPGYVKRAYARNVWDMHRVGTRIYFGHGNSASASSGNAGNAGPAPEDLNAGPVAIWYYEADPLAASAGFQREPVLGGAFAPDASDEQIDGFRELDSGFGTQLHFTGHDPRGADGRPRFYRREATGWRVYDGAAPASGVLHTYDLARLGSSVIAGVGVNALTGFALAATVPVTTGTGWAAASPTVNPSYRAYQLFPVGANTYASVENLSTFQQLGTWVARFNGTSFEALAAAEAEAFFRPDLGAVPCTRVVVTTPPGFCQGFYRVVRPVVFGAATVYIAARLVNDHQWVPFDGALYRASGTVSAAAPAQRLTGGGLPANEDWKPWDLLVDQATATLYVLGSEPNGSLQTVTVHSSRDLATWTEVFRFDAATFARSFERLPNGDFYFGLGSHWEGGTTSPPLPAGDPESLPVTAAHAATGQVLRVRAAAYQPATGPALRVALASSHVPVSGVLAASLLVSTGTQPVDGAAFHLDFDPTKVVVTNAAGAPVSQLTATGPFENLLQSSVDNALGRIDFASGSSLAGAPPSGTFTVATFHLKGVGEASAAQLSFATAPGARQTELTSGGASVLTQLISDPLAVTAGSTLLGSIGLPGRGSTPSSRWVVPLTVWFYPPAGTTPVLTQAVTTTTSATFQASVSPIGTYDVRLKEPHSLSQQRAGIGLTQSYVTTTFGTLTVGDVNGDDVISIADFSLLRTTFGKDQSSGGFDPRADLDGDGAVNTADFDWLRTNFGLAGPRGG